MRRGVSEHKRRVAAVYNLAARGYDKPAVRFFPLMARRLVEIAGVRSGQTVLDAGAGTGTAAIPAAHQVGPQGRVVAVDIATEMMEQARRNIHAVGLSNVDIQYGDIEQLPFADNHFDVVLCAAGIFFLPDMWSGIREWQSVTKPGGTVALTSFGERAFQPMSNLYEARIRSYGVSLPAPTRPFAWQRLSDPEQCRGLLCGTQLQNVDVRVEQLGYYLNSIDEWWEIVWNTGFRGPVSRLSPDKLIQFTTRAPGRGQRAADDARHLARRACYHRCGAKTALRNRAISSNFP